MVLHPESMTADAKLVLQNENRGLCFSAKIQQKKVSTLGLSGKHQAGNKFVYNEGLRWTDETEVGSDFLKRSKGTRPRSSKTTQEWAGGSQEEEAEAAEIGHYVVTEVWAVKEDGLHIWN